MPSLSHTIEEQLPAFFRLDRYISESLNLLSRSQIKVRNLSAKINGKEVKISKPVKQGDHLELNWMDSPPIEIIAQDLPIDIVYEDDNCVVINKAQGMVVHPGAGNRQGTLANALYYRRLNKLDSKNKNNPENAGCQSSVRPGIVHRLDKETSGIIIAAYNDEAHVFLADQFKTRKTKKTYIAIVHGTPKETEGRIETFITRDSRDRKKFTVGSAGKSALTFYKVIKSWNSHSLLLLRPRTGRTHQLRVHLRHIGNPVLGDPIYHCKEKRFSNALIFETSLMLHSKSLAITLPGESERRIFTSAMPERFIDIIKKLDNINLSGYTP